RGRPNGEKLSLWTALKFHPTEIRRLPGMFATSSSQRVTTSPQSFQVARSNVSQATAEAPTPSIERTSQRPLRALCAAAHVEREKSGRAAGVLRHAECGRVFRERG